ncbi:MAG: Ig domain-containing protein [Clostridia bacterium]|nr:Ig domain-containing protein [Clostridia bacterium]
MHRIRLILAISLAAALLFTAFAETVDPAECVHPETAEEWMCAVTVQDDQNGRTHTAVTHGARVVRCTVCGLVLEQGEDETLETQVSEHLYPIGEDICVECGYRNTCTHAETIRETWIAGEATDDGNGKTHTISGVEYEAVTCLLCGAQRAQGPTGNTVSRTEAHWYEAGSKVCGECGYENTCEHAHTQSTERVEEIYVDDGNGGTHTLQRIAYGETRCLDCDAVLAQTASEPEIVASLAHEYAVGGDICLLCGAINACAHASTQTVQWLDGSALDDGNGETHTTTGNLIEDTVCTECGSIRARRVAEAGVTRTEAHWFAPDSDACAVCGYSSECAHLQTAEYGRYDLGSATYASISDRCHSVTAPYIVQEICLRCGALVGETEAGETKLTDIHLYNQKGVCALCGHQNACAHARTRTQTYAELQGALTNQGDTHTATGRWHTLTVCALCGAEISDTAEKAQTLTLAHSYQNGVCACGSVNTCAHAHTETVDLIDGWAKDDGNGETHTLIGPQYRVTRCTDCGQTLERAFTAAQGSQAQPHETDEASGVCALCGYDPDPIRVLTLQSGKNAALTLNVGEKLMLAVNFDGGKGVKSWKSNKTSVASVAGGGVSAKAAGKATITVTANNGKKATIAITVKDPYAPTSVKFAQSSYTVNIGETLTLTPQLSPATARATYTWKSSKTSVATVKDGVVTPKAEGTAKMTATTHNGKKATVTIRVIDPTKPTGIRYQEGTALTMKVGDSLALTPVLAPETAVSKLTWKSSKTSVAKVKDGVVQAIKAGKAKITVATANKKKAVITITVVK